MEKLLADCLETLRPSPLNQRDKPPAAPPLSAQAQARSSPGASSTTPSAAAQQGANRAPRARQLAARGAPGGQSMQLQTGSLHFQGRGSNNKPSGAAS